MRLPRGRGVGRLLVALACGIALAAAARAALPPLSGWAIRRAVEAATGMPATLEGVHLRLLAGEVRLGPLRVRHPRSRKPVAGWEEVRLRLRYRPLLHRTARLEVLQVKDPFVALAWGEGRAPDDAIPLSAFATPRSAEGPPVHLDVARLEVRGGRVSLRPAQAPGRAVTLDALAVSLADVATMPAGAARPSSLRLAARWDGAPIDVAGWVKPLAPLPEADLTLHADDVDLSKLGLVVLGIMEAGSGAPVLEAGRAAARGRLTLRPDGRAEVSGTLELRGPSVALDGGATRVSARAIRVSAQGFDPRALVLREGRVAAEGLAGEVRGEAGAAGRAASVDAAIQRLDLGARAAGALSVNLGEAEVTLGAGRGHLAARSVRARAGALDLAAASLRGVSLELDGLTARGVGGRDAAGGLDAARASARRLDLGRGSGEEVRLEVQGLAARGLGGPDGTVQLAACRAAARSLRLREPSGAGVTLDLQGLALGGVGGPAGTATLDGLRASAGALRLRGGLAEDLAVELEGLAARGLGGRDRGAEVRRLRAAADRLAVGARTGSGVALEAGGIRLRGIGDPGTTAAIGDLRAEAAALDLAGGSGRGLRLRARGAEGTGLGPSSLSAAARAVEAAAGEVAAGGRALRDMALSVEGVTAAAGLRPLGSLERLRAAAGSLDLAAGSGTALRLEAEQVAVAELGPQGLTARVQGVRAGAGALDLRGPAVREASLAVDWLAAARAGEGEPFAVLRGIRAEGVAVDPAAPVAIEAARLEADAPVLRVRRDAAGIDLARLAGASAGGRGAAAPPPSRIPLSPSAVAVGIAQVHDGVVHFADATVSPEASLDLTQVTVNLLNHRPGARAPATLVASARIGREGTLQAGAQFTPGTIDAANGTARLENLEVDIARPYLKLPPPLAAITGRVTAEAEARPAGPAAPGPPAGRAAGWKIVARVEGRSLAGRDGRGAALAEMAGLEAREIEVSVPDLAVTVGEVAARGVRFPVERDAAGALHLAGLPLASLVPPAPARPPGAAAPSFPPVRLRRVRLAGTVPLVDRARPYPLETALTDLALEVTDVATQGDRPAGVSVEGRLEEMTFRAAGAFRWRSLRGQGRAELKGMDVVRWADYLPDAIRGRLADLRGAAQLDVTFGPSLEDLVIRGRIDAAPLQLAEPEGDGVVGVERATIALERLTLAPFALHASSVALERPWIRLERRPGGRINLLELLPPRAPGGGGAAPGPGGAPAPLADLRIDRLTLQNGAVTLLDSTLSPPFRERARRVTGTVTSLSTDGATRATFELSGSLGDGGQLVLRGHGVPRLEAPSVELEGHLALDMVSLSPYVRRLTSHRVERGKVELEVSYRLAGRELVGENHIRLDQFGVGEAEEWPDKFTELAGVSLPFAVSLLQDGDGVVDLQVPVRGDVASPQFDFGDVIRTAIANAVVRTVTAPLRWIGKIFEAAGRIEAIEIAPILFDPGSRSLNPAGEEAVGRVVAFLKEAPGVRIQLAGFAEPERDGKAMEAAAAARRGARAALRRLARRLGVGGAPPPPDLRGLARSRAVAVQEALRRAGIGSGRVFLAEPAVEPATAALERQKPPQGRVEFRLLQ